MKVERTMAELLALQQEVNAESAALARLGIRITATGIRFNTVVVRVLGDIDAAKAYLEPRYPAGALEVEARGFVTPAGRY